MSAKITGLDLADIESLLAAAKTHNAYGPRLLEFVDSDEPGVNVQEVWPEFKGKKATTLYQGFRNASEKANLTDTVRILARDEQVFLLHNERVRIAVSEAQPEAA